MKKLRSLKNVKVLGKVEQKDFVGGAKTSCPYCLSVCAHGAAWTICDPPNHLCPCEGACDGNGGWFYL